MAGKSYVTKGYSTYTNISPHQGGYGHGPERLKPIHTPAAAFTDFVGSPTKIELLKEYVHAPSMSSGPKYASSNHYEAYEPNHGLNYKNSSPPKYHGKDVIKKAHNEAIRPMKTDPIRGYPSEEVRLGLEGARHMRTGNKLGPDRSWRKTGPPTTHHPITTPTNNINEALGFLEESVNHSGGSDPRRTGVLDELSTRAQPKPQSRYARPAFVGKTHDGHHNHTNRQTVIGSHKTR